MTTPKKKTPAPAKAGKAETKEARGADKGRSPKATAAPWHTIVKPCAIFAAFFGAGKPFIAKQMQCSKPAGNP